MGFSFTFCFLVTNIKSRWDFNVTQNNILCYDAAYGNTPELLLSPIAFNQPQTAFC